MSRTHDIRRMFSTAARWILACTAVFTSSIAFTGTPRLVLDINQKVTVVDSNPALLGQFGDATLLLANVGYPVNTTAALVRSDGTPEGTFVIKTINGPGRPQLGSASVRNLIQIGSRAYFVAQDRSAGPAVWVTDGTSAGTHVIADVIPGANVTTIPQLFAAVGNNLLFVAQDFWEDTYQLYRTDGTQAGTYALTAFKLRESGPLVHRTFSANGRNVQASAPVVVNGKAYFQVFDDQGGRFCCQVKLWVSDGTPSGTHEVTSVTALAPDAYPRSLQVVNGAVLLVANTSAYGIELVRIDPATDTATVLDLAPGAANGVSNMLTALDGFALFAGSNDGASTQLWRTDGTAAGTWKVSDVSPDSSASTLHDEETIMRIGNRVVFAGRDATHGWEIWGSDGTPEGTAPLTALTDSPGWLLSAVHRTARRLYLSLMYSTTNLTFYRRLSTDGSPGGTYDLPAPLDGDSALLNAVAGDASVDYLRFVSTDPATSQRIYRLYRHVPGNGQPLTLIASSTEGLADNMIVSNGKLLFDGFDTANGRELWAGDGAGAQLLKNLAPDTHTETSDPQWLTEWQGKLVFVANDGIHGAELWISDGTTSGTQLLYDILPGKEGSNPQQLAVMNDALYFIASDGEDRLMRMDSPGTAPHVLTTVGRYKFMEASRICSSPRPVVLGNRLFFTGTSSDYGEELWSSDGTAAGTAQAADIRPGPLGSDPCYLTTFRNRVYFTATSGSPSNHTVWYSDGTVEGTSILVELENPPVNAQRLSVTGNHLYFLANDPAPLQLWQSDGTSAGTRPLIPESVPDLIFTAYPAGTLGARTVLARQIGETGSPLQFELWITDGTAVGTTKLLDRTTSSISPLVDGDRIYFTDFTDGQPWITDGTPAGTRRIADVNPGGRDLIGFFKFRGTTLFVAQSQLWRTDGTEAGTIAWGEIPGGAIRSPSYLTEPARIAIGQNLFFTTWTQSLGYELYVAPNDPPITFNDNVSTTVGQALIVNVLANDTDGDGLLNPSTVRVVQSPTHGTVTVTPTGSITYTPAAGYVGTDLFTYTVADDMGHESTAATVNITVGNSAPPNDNGSNAGNTGGGGSGGGALSIWEVLLLTLLLAYLRRGHLVLSTRSRH